jgi:hypothetical protein
MDEAYYLRLADQERKRHEGHLRKVSEADREIAKRELAADKALEAAERTSSAATAKSKRSEAERHRKAAATARENRAKASKAAAESQSKINEYERKAREAAGKQRKKEGDARAAAPRTKPGARQSSSAGISNARTAVWPPARRPESARFSIFAPVPTSSRRCCARPSSQRPSRSACSSSLGRSRVGGSRCIYREIREIDQKVRASEYRDQIRFEHLHATQIRDIMDGLNRHDPDVVHFSGHGDRRSLLFEVPDGRPHDLRDEHLGLLLQVARKPIRLVVLNACESAEQAALATDYVGAAIGMAEPIDDDTAKVFAGQFYASLAEGNSLANTFDQARVQARVVNDDEEAQPRLFVRDGVDADEIVLVAP